MLVPRLPDESYKRWYLPKFFLASEPIGAHGHPDWYLSKPLGYSWFPQDIEPVPQSWVATTGNLVFYRQHVKVRINPALLSTPGFFSVLQPDLICSIIGRPFCSTWTTWWAASRHQRLYQSGLGNLKAPWRVFPTTINIQNPLNMSYTSLNHVQSAHTRNPILIITLHKSL